MKHLTIVLASSLLVATTTHAHANDRIEAGKKKAVICASCHGSNGISHSPLWPNLAGQKAAYLEKQLKDFKSGARKDPMMTPFATMLTEEEMKDLAAYYASLTP